MSLNEIKNKVRQRRKTSFQRTVGSTNLIAVSKVQPNERIEAVLDQGHRIFGENRIQEAQSKWPDFKEQYEMLSYILLVLCKQIKLGQLWSWQIVFIL